PFSRPPSWRWPPSPVRTAKAIPAFRSPWSLQSKPSRPATRRPLPPRPSSRTIGCTTADGLGGPRKCQPGQQEGAPVEVLPGAACEGYHIAKGDEPGSFAGFLDGEISLDSAYRTAGNALFPAGYVLLMTFSNGQVPEHARALFLDDSGVTGIFLGCVHTLDQR